MFHLLLKYFSDTHGNVYESGCSLKLTLENVFSLTLSGYFSKYWWFLTTRTDSGCIQSSQSHQHITIKVSLRLDSDKHANIIAKQYKTNYVTYPITLMLNLF